jgi:hypothetical protein
VSHGHWHVRPRAWLGRMTQKYPSATTDEVKARPGKNWDADVKAFNAVYHHILMMARGGLRKLEPLDQIPRRALQCHFNAAGLSDG